ncbi:MAG: ATP-binding cassette domain-containing protein, partial [Pyrinomonadaceae bacterium]
HVFLARFLFTGDDVYKKVGDLSGGEKGRLALAKLIYSRVNVLVLDEPTNHLDIPSREALEEALDAYDGTILTISHDRYFLDRVATQILSLDGRGTRRTLRRRLHRVSRLESS